MRPFALGTCLLLLVIEHTLGNITATTAGAGGITTDTNLTAMAMNTTTAQPSNISTPASVPPNSDNSSSHAASGTGNGTMITTARAILTTVHNSNPGASNGTSVGTTGMSNATSAHTQAPLANHTHGVAQGPSSVKPSKGGSTALLGLPSTVLGALLCVLLSHP